MDLYKPKLIHLVWNGFSLLLSFMIVIILSADFFLAADDSVNELILVIDKIACAVFFSEFVYRLVTSKNKLRYMRWGWLDLIAAIPITWFRFARLLKIVAIIRTLYVLRRFFKLQRIFRLNYSARDVAGFIFLFFVLCLLLMIGLGSVLVLYFEEHGGGAINTPAEAVWWTLVTVTTVGYGDYYPITAGGRAIALALMFFGIGLFSTLTVYISSFLLKLFSDGQRRSGRAAITIEDLALDIKEMKNDLAMLYRAHQQTFGGKKLRRGALLSPSAPQAAATSRLRKPTQRKNKPNVKKASPKRTQKTPPRRHNVTKVTKST